MKKYISMALVCSSFAVCFAVDLSRYQDVQFMQDLNVVQPSIVEITNLNQLGNYIVTDNDGNVIQQQSQIVRKSSVVSPLKVDGCTSTCKDASLLADGRTDTTFDFPLISSGIQKGKIKIVYAKPLLTDSVVFQTTRDSYMPTAFTLMIDGKRILNTIQGGSARFPKMMAQNVEIEFEYNQPIRFTEVGVGLNREETVTSQVRFVYQPGTKYLFYTNSPTGRDGAPSPTVNLFAKKVEAEIVLEESHKNPLYKERDTDTDGVVDALDNCPMQMNPDQKDGNGNGLGDICDDYDYDGVATYVDNCPEIENPHQEDKDRDGLGDACDSEESRITEKYGWIPWVVFLGVFIAVGAMGYEVMKMKKGQEGGKV